MREERIISIKELTASTYSVKDNSVRGVHTASRSQIKIGDEVVIDNYFTRVCAVCGATGKACPYSPNENGIYPCRTECEIGKEFSRNYTPLHDEI